MSYPFIVKDTLAEVKSLTSTEISDLENGVFKGVQLLGYYIKGDTSIPINYYYSNALEDDDGGSIIAVPGLTGRLKVNSVIDNVVYFGLVPITDEDDGIDYSPRLLKMVNYKKTLPLNQRGIFFPGGIYIVNMITLTDCDSFVIYGDSSAVIVQKVINVALFWITSTDSLKIEFLKIKGNGIKRPIGSGGAINHLINTRSSNNIQVRSCEIYDSSGGGCCFMSTNNVTVSDNYFHGNRDMFDVAFGYDYTEVGLNGFICSGNIMESNNSYGVHLMGFGKDIQVTNNRICHKLEYGIMVYHASSLQSNEWENMVIDGNIVYDITDGSGTDKKGMGIYLQTGTRISVSNNIVRDVMKGRIISPVNRQLAPGAISINGSREVTCIGNVIEKSVIDGIAVAGSSSSTSKGTVIANNNILDIGRQGISITACSNLTVDSNIITGVSGDVGIYILSSASKTCEKIKIANNTINNGFDSGISFSLGTGTSIDNVDILSNTIYGIKGQYLVIQGLNYVNIDSNSFYTDGIVQNTANSAVRLSNTSNFKFNNNIIMFTKSTSFQRGVYITNCLYGILTGNLVRGVTESMYTIYTLTSSDLLIVNNQLSPV